MQRAAAIDPEPHVARLHRRERGLPLAERVLVACDLAELDAVIADLDDQRRCALEAAILTIDDLDATKCLRRAEVDLDPRLLFFGRMEEHRAACAAALHILRVALERLAARAPRLAQREVRTLK